MKGISFNTQFEPLPTHLETLQVELVSLMVDKDINKIIELDVEMNNYNLEIQGQDILINNIIKKNDGTYITFTTKEGVVLSKVYLIIDGVKVNLKETIGGSLDKDKAGGIFYTRTMHFPKAGESYKLDVNRMTYIEEFNKIIEIPIK